MAQKQYTITLWRLNIPQHINIAKIRLWLTGNRSFQPIFIQRDVKNYKVNFYRQTFFLNTVQKGLTFTFSAVHHDSSVTTLTKYEITPLELVSIQKRSALFHHNGESFEFLWECRIFQGEDEQFYCESDHDYTELNSSFQNQNQFLFNQLQTLQEEGLLKLKGDNKCDNVQDTTISTLETLNEQLRNEKDWRQDEDFQIAIILKDQVNQQPKREQDKQQAIYKKVPKPQNFALKEKFSIKSQLYSSLMSKVFSKLRR